MRSLVLACLLAMPALASADQAVDDLHDVKPILAQRCYACHSGLKQRGELRLDTGALILKGGDSGPAVSPGHAEKSLLIEKGTAKDEAERMPPEGKPLSAEQIALLT